MNPKRYFLSIDWCNKGKRGLFCYETGDCFYKDDEPFTKEEIDKIFGEFAIIVNPESLVLSKEELDKYMWFRTLPEYKNKYGIVLKKDDL